MTDCSPRCVRLIGCLSTCTGAPITVTYCRNCWSIKSITGLSIPMADDTQSLETVYRSVYRISAISDKSFIFHNRSEGEISKIIELTHYAKSLCPKAEFLCFEVTCPNCLASAVKVPGSYLGFVTIEDPDVS